MTVNGFLIHHGLIDSMKTERSGGQDFMSISSRSFTSLLCQNQIEPGLKMDISFNMLMDDYYSLPYVTHEDSSTLSYIYVKSNTSMWDAASNLSYKLLGTYPYIRGTNNVMISPFSAPQAFDLTNEKLLSVGTELMCCRLASNYHMAGIDGEYGNFELADSTAEQLKIVRHKYFDLDMRFLYDPQQALEYRDKYDSHGQKRIFCSYSGYHGEDLYDLVSFGSIDTEPVGCISVKGSSKGIFTEIGVYKDKFPH